MGDCTVLSDRCIVMWVTLSIQAPETPDKSIDWPNADVMVGHRLRRWSNIIETETLQVLITIFNRECIFPEQLLKTYFNLGTSNVRPYTQYVHKD